MTTALRPTLAVGLSSGPYLHLPAYFFCPPTSYHSFHDSLVTSPVCRFYNRGNSVCWTSDLMNSSCPLQGASMIHGLHCNLSQSYHSTPTPRMLDRVSQPPCVSYRAFVSFSLLFCSGPLFLFSSYHSLMGFFYSLSSFLYTFHPPPNTWLPRYISSAF